jgi:hypothetical protein
MIKIDQIVSLIGEEGALARRSSLACGGISDRQLFRCDRRRRPERGIVEHRQIFADSMAGTVWRQIIVAINHVLPAHVRPDQAGVDRKAFASD